MIEGLISNDSYYYCRLKGKKSRFSRLKIQNKPKIRFFKSVLLQELNYYLYYNFHY